MECELSCINSRPNLVGLQGTCKLRHLREPTRPFLTPSTFNVPFPTLLWNPEPLGYPPPYPWAHPATAYVCIRQLPRYINADLESRPVDRCLPRGLGEASDTYTFPSAPAAHYPSQGYSPCLYPIFRPCNNSIASTGLHPTSTTNFVMCFMGRSINNACRTFRAMIWCGLSTTWTM